MPGVKTAKLPGFEGITPPDRRRRDSDRPAGTEPALHLFAADGGARSQGPRPQDRRCRRPRRASHRHRKRNAWRCDPDDVRQGTADRRYHPSGPRPRRPSRRRSTVAISTRPCSTSAGSTPTAPRIPRPNSPRQDIIIRLAPIAAMSGLPATLPCSSRSTRCFPICKALAPSPNLAAPLISPTSRPANRSFSAMSG